MKDRGFRHLVNWLNTRFVTLAADLHCECGEFGDAALAIHDGAVEASGGLGRAAKLR